jgi:hypothetical protein
LKRIFKSLLAFAFLANAGMAAATDVPFPTHTVIVKAGATYDGIQYPIGTEVSLSDSSNAVGNVLLSQDFAMNGHVIKKGTRLSMLDGKLSCYWSKQGQAIAAIVLNDGAQVCFEKAGQLNMIHLKLANNILGHPFAANSWVQFHPGGKVAEGTLAEDVRKAGFTLAGGSKITFHPSGSVDSAAVKPGAIFAELRLGKRPNDNSDLSFWPNGKLKEALLAHPARIGNASCTYGDISFKESGALKYCVMLKKTDEQLAAEAAQQVFSTMADANMVRATVKTPGVVSLIAGSLEMPGTAGSDAKEFASKDGVGAAARFARPTALVADRAGNLFLTESGASHHLVRRISTAGVVTTIAGNKGGGYQNGAASSARFQDLAGIAIDKEGHLYVADRGNNVIRKISTKGVVSTFARLSSPTGIALDKAGKLYVSSLKSSALRRIDRGGAIATYAGSEHEGYSMDGNLEVARFVSIDTMAFDPAGNLFVGDRKLLRMISRAGMVSTLGNYADSYKDVAYMPEVLLIDPAGNLYFAVNSTIRKLTPTGLLSTVAGVAGQHGNKPGVVGLLENPKALVMLGPKTFAFISGNAVLKLVLP